MKIMFLILLLTQLGDAATSIGKRRSRLWPSSPQAESAHRAEPTVECAVHTRTRIAKQRLGKKVGRALSLGI
jgi:hypothetical protein